MKTIIATHAVTTECFAPVVAYDDAERHPPEILTRRRADAIGDSLAFLGQLRELVLAEVYLDHKAVALALECPIWTEDNDFLAQESQR